MDFLSSAFAGLRIDSAVMCGDAKPAFSREQINTVGKILCDIKQPLAARFRALFILRNIGCDLSVEWIGKCFGDSSALLKHELAYCLGQTGNKSAIPLLSSVLEDENQETIVRHEAAEALGAIGDPSTIPILQKYFSHHEPAIAETCDLAIRRIQWLSDQRARGEPVVAKSPYDSVDPAPACSETDVKVLGATLIDGEKSLWERYRAMFALRNLNTDDSVKALAQGLYCTDSALFRHEVAYVLGQTQSPVAVESLRYGLERVEENHMVRHECAEALGAIATDECEQLLKKYLNDSETVVKESCLVALDMADYENSEQFQYASVA